MEIIINGKQAYLKKNTSFDFIFENRLFTGSDSYTLTITFPLKGCARNIAIFGHIHRADVIKSKVVFDCDIRDGAFLKSGSITITEISDVEVKTQFLNGGNFAAADADGSSVANPPALVYYASQHTKVPETIPFLLAITKASKAWSSKAFANATVLTCFLLKT